MVNISRNIYMNLRLEVILVLGLHMSYVNETSHEIYVNFRSIVILHTCIHFTYMCTCVLYTILVTGDSYEYSY